MKGYLDHLTLQWVLRALHDLQETIEDFRTADEVGTEFGFSQELCLKKIQNGIVWAERQLSQRNVEPLKWARSASERRTNV